eukprot:TRINITY_DN33087_c0_g1_i1.p2 TRINITY_DN33087_c0_g1~~TRINITY_DN33087_c0_g1_i1.p2  ORF type:complete len:349 (+),score=62.74 TRINITY_DN33087_c0_g1_i1:1247-2293(+)
MDVVPETIAHDVPWEKVLLMFSCKLCAMTLATAAGGPGGTLVPSLTAGGIVGILIGQLTSRDEASTAACAIVGMGSLFASLMRMPVTGVVMMYELTGARDLVVHVIFANFVAANVASRLPGGSHSFVHLALEHDPVWVSLGQDFIETDAQEQNALNTVGIKKILQFKTEAIRYWLMPDKVLLGMAFREWQTIVSSMGAEERQRFQALEARQLKYMAMMFAEKDEAILRRAWNALVRNVILELRRRANLSKQPAPIEGVGHVKVRINSVPKKVRARIERRHSHVIQVPHLLDSSGDPGPPTKEPPPLQSRSSDFSSWSDDTEAEALSVSKLPRLPGALSYDEHPASKKK